MTDNELLQAMSDLLDQKLQPIKDELGTVQRDVKHLKKEAIKMQNFKGGRKSEKRR